MKIGKTISYLLPAFLLSALYGWILILIYFLSNNHLYGVPLQ
jgi:hypothetical protein